MNVLDRQRRSREKLSQAAARYANLRVGDGKYTPGPIRTVNAVGRPVTVLVELVIFSEES